MKIPVIHSMTPPSLLFKPVWTCSTESSRHTHPATFLSSTGMTTGKKKLEKRRFDFSEHF